MNKKDPEQERKELNKKLIKRTFVSEMRERKHIRITKFIIDMVCTFIGLYLSDLLTETLSMDSKLLKMGITILIIVIVLKIEEVITEKISASKNQ